MAGWVKRLKKKVGRARKVVKPTPEEKTIIERRLRRKYPQMYEVATSPGTAKKLEGLSPSDRKELEKMIGKKLKGIYK